MTMPPILQGHLSPLAYSLGESVGRRLADMYLGESNRCLIGIASLHQCYQVGLCTASVFLVLHLFSSLVHVTAFQPYPALLLATVAVCSLLANAIARYLKHRGDW
jgi:hypothetical protein